MNLRAVSKESSATRLAASPMACNVIWKPAASRSTTIFTSSSGLMSSRPRLAGSSAKGSSMAAEREPPLPSVTPLSAPVLSQGSVVPPSRRMASSFSSEAAKGSHSVTRSVSFPSSFSARKARKSSQSELSWMEVTPRRAASAIASSKPRLRCSAVGGGMSFSTRSVARSLSHPVGSPAASLTISPP